MKCKRKDFFIRPLFYLCLVSNQSTTRNFCWLYKKYQMKKLLIVVIVIFACLSSCIKTIKTEEPPNSTKTLTSYSWKAYSKSKFPTITKDTIILRDTVMVINTVTLRDTVIMGDTITIRDTIVMRDTIIISPPPIPVTNIDIDGNVYDTVRIGSQTWMKENLRVTRLNDGGRIVMPYDTPWDRIISPGFCWYNNDMSNKDTYGALYNWWAAVSDKLCPVGWHVPTVNEWEILGHQYRSSGMVELMETGTNHWIAGTGTNTTGFTALPGGGAGYDSTGMKFSGMGISSDYWTPDGPDYSHGGGLWAYPIPWVDPWGMTPTSTLTYDPHVGLSVRCLKN